MEEVVQSLCVRSEIPLRYNFGAFFGIDLVPSICSKDYSVQRSCGGGDDGGGNSGNSGGNSGDGLCRIQ